MTKFWSVVLILAVALVLPLNAVAQEANVQLTVSIPLGPEEDIAQCVLYASPTGVNTEYGEAARITGITPLSPTQDKVLRFNYQFYAAPSAETARYFKATFIDTSGNESVPSDPVKFVADKLPPGKPLTPSIEVVEMAQ